MKRILLLCIILFAISCGDLSAQSTLNWLKNYTSERSNLNDVAIKMDNGGNTWLKTRYIAPVEIKELSIKFNYPLHSATALLRISPEGKTEKAYNFGSVNGYAEVKDFEIAPNNDVWIIGYFKDDMKLEGKSDSAVIKKEGLNLFIAVIKANGKIKFARTLEQKYSTDMLRLAFESNGTCHALILAEEHIYEPYNGKEVKSKKFNHLYHLWLNEKAEILKSDKISLGQYVYGGLAATRIHITPADEIYISTSFAKDIHINDSLVIQSTYIPAETHALLLHFNKQGKFTWYKTASGSGSQLFTNITSDYANVYLSGYYHYECFINQENKIYHDPKPITTGDCIFFSAISHTGNLKWTRYETTRNYSNASLLCKGLETDGRGNLFAFCNFNDSVVISGKYKDYWLRAEKKNSPSSPFVMQMDTQGNVLDLRRDIIHRKGKTFVLESSANKGRFVVVGSYGGALKGLEEANSEAETHLEMNGKKYKTYTTETDLQVQLGEKSLPFEHHAAGGIFAYSFSIKPEEKKQDSVFALIPLKDSTALSIIDGTNYDFTARDSGDVKIISRIPTQALQVKLYPNPTKGPLTIEIKGIEEFCNIYICDVAGKLLYSQSVRAENPELKINIDAANWAAENYLLTVISGKNKKATKIWVKVN